MSEILREIQGLDQALSGIILHNIVIDKSGGFVEFNFINNKTYGETSAEKIAALLDKRLALAAKIKVNIIKKVCDAQILGDEVFGYIGKNFPLAAAFLKRKDISAKEITTGDGGSCGFKYSVKVIDGGLKYMEANGVLKSVDRYLKKNFCEEISGGLVLSDEEFHAKEILSKAAKMELFDLEEPQKRRVFKFEAGEEVDGEILDEYALYMADCDFATDKLTVCGSIKAIEEKQTQKGKPYFVLELSDGTFDDPSKTIKAKIFLRKGALYEKYAALKVGDSVIASGRMELFNNTLSLNIDKMKYGNPPKDFVPEKKKSKSPPPEYITVKPQPYAEVAQENLFESVQLLPDEIMNNTFVVFDLETTGLVTNPYGLEKMDTIIEVGAVKLHKGKIIERFESFVKPDREITEEITRITGIDNQMVADAPALEQVLPDFFKFTRGAVLVAHNSDFDMKFIDYYSKQLGYIYDNRVIDTVRLSQEVMHLKNNKLKTLAEHFGFDFNHHRAYEDAHVTAKIFIELTKIKESR